jgi:signal transduction histidine kinase
MQSADDRRGRRSRLAFLGALAGGLAHEIKNPLSAMAINLQMMREDLEDSDQARDKRLLRRVAVLDREVTRLEEILEGFLRFARGYSLNLTRQSINNLLRETVEFWAARANASGVEVELILGSDLPDVMVDPTYLKQALLNLLNNALEAILSKKDEDEPNQIILGSRVRGSSIEILVIDSGPGIPEETARRIFDPYFSTKPTGSGLGLATARRIVEDHTGRLSVESTPGRGTSFKITLPIAEPPRPQPGKEEAAPEQPAPEKLAEDVEDL